MPDERDKPGEPPEAASADDAENERPTVTPPFDPVAFAREVLKPSPAPMRAVPSPFSGGPHTSVTPPQGIAHQAVLAASRPPPMPPDSDRSGSVDWQDVRRKKTPTSTLSLANARIPSNLPPRLGSEAGPERAESRSAATSPVEPTDEEFSSSDYPTKPPPSDGPAEDPVLEIAQAPQLDLDDIGLDEGTNGGATPGVALFGDDLDIEQVDSRPEDTPGADTVRKHEPQSSSLGGRAKSPDREMADRVSLGDYSGALEIAEQILSENPGSSAATACAENCRAVLRQMYVTRIGQLDRVPVVSVPREQLRWLSIDHKAGFVLSLIDGVSTVEMIIDVSGMAELDALRILSELAQQRIISLR